MAKKITSPYYLPDDQPWAVDQMRRRHNDALYYLGEYAIFVLMWRSEDQEAGLVSFCPDCTFEDPAFETYRQTADPRCPRCFGTQFANAEDAHGFKARLVRPSLWDFGEVSNTSAVRGEVVQNVAAIQTTSDFRLRTSDFIIKGDNTRWQMRDNATTRLRTGFELPLRGRTVMGYSYDNAHLEDESSVAYLIPPINPTELQALLDIGHAHWPIDFSAIDEINGPLLDMPQPARTLKRTVQDGVGTIDSRGVIQTP